MSKVQFDQHLYEGHLTEEGKLKCKVCGKLSKDNKAFDSHIRNHHNITPQTYFVKYANADETLYHCCEICGEYTKMLNTHIKTTHKDTTSEEYKEKYNFDGSWSCKGLSDQKSAMVSGDNNPMHSSNTTEEFRKSCSPFSKKFRGYTELNDKEKEKAVSETASKANQTRDDNNTHTTRLEYWIEKCDGDIEAAKKARAERQTTFSMNKCIEKYGEYEGTEVWYERQQKWKNTLIKNGNMFCGYSKISQELFDRITDHFHSNDFQYHTKGGELKFQRDKYTYSYDFVDNTNNKIIEYNGDMFHGNPATYEYYEYPDPIKKENGLRADQMWERDKNKQEFAENMGYEYLVIWDSEYRKNPDKIVKECVNFLKQN